MIMRSMHASFNRVIGSVNDRRYGGKPGDYLDAADAVAVDEASFSQFPEHLRIDQAMGIRNYLDVHVVPERLAAALII